MLTDFIGNNFDLNLNYIDLLMSFYIIVFLKSIKTTSDGQNNGLVRLIEWTDKEFFSYLDKEDFTDPDMQAKMHVLEYFIVNKQTDKIPTHIKATCVSVLNIAVKASQGDAIPPLRTSESNFDQLDFAKSQDFLYKLNVPLKNDSKTTARKKSKLFSNDTSVICEHLLNGYVVNESTIFNFFEEMCLFLIRNMKANDAKTKIFCFTMITTYVQSFQQEGILNSKKSGRCSKMDLKSRDDLSAVRSRNFYHNMKGIEVIVIYILEESNEELLLIVICLANLLLSKMSTEAESEILETLKKIGVEAIEAKVEGLISKLFEEVLASFKIENKACKKEFENIIDYNFRFSNIKKLYDKNHIWYTDLDNSRHATKVRLLKSCYTFISLLVRHFGIFVKKLENDSAPQHPAQRLLRNSLCYLQEFLLLNFLQKKNLCGKILDFITEIIQRNVIAGIVLLHDFRLIESLNKFIFDYNLNECIYRETYVNKFGLKFDLYFKKMSCLCYFALGLSDGAEVKLFLKKHFSTPILLSKLTENTLGSTQYPEMMADSIYLKTRDAKNKNRQAQKFYLYFLANRMDIDLQHISPIDLADYRMLSAQVEVKSNDELQTTDFIVNDVCQFMTKELRAGLLQQVETHKGLGKINFLIDNMESIFVKLEHQNALSKHKVLRKFQEFKFKKIFGVLIIVINTIITFGMEAQFNGTYSSSPSFTAEFLNAVYKVATYLLFGVCCLQFGQFLIFQTRIVFKVFWNRRVSAMISMLDKETLFGSYGFSLNERAEGIGIPKNDILKVIQMYEEGKSDKREYLLTKFAYFFNGVKYVFFRSKFSLYN